MGKIVAPQAMRELTMMLLYLSRYQDRDLPCVDGEPVYHSWKALSFGILNGLEHNKYIDQGARPYKNKSVELTEVGMEEGKRLLEKYGIADVEKKPVTLK